MDGRINTIVSSDDWDKWPPGIKPAIKLGNLKLFECPLTAITAQTWEIIRTVNQTSDENGQPLATNYNDWRNLPEWLQEAYQITQRERADNRRKVQEAQLGKKSR